MVIRTQLFAALGQMWNVYASNLLVIPGAVVPGNAPFGVPHVLATPSRKMRAVCVPDVEVKPAPVGGTLPKVVLTPVGGLPVGTLIDSARGDGSCVAVTVRVNEIVVGQTVFGATAKRNGVAVDAEAPLANVPNE